MTEQLSLSIVLKKQKVMSHMKGQDKTPEKQLNAGKIGKLLVKEFRIMTFKMIQDLGNRTETKTEKILEIVTKGLEELKNKER